MAGRSPHGEGGSPPGKLGSMTARIPAGSGQPHCSRDGQNLRVSPSGRPLPAGRTSPDPLPPARFAFGGQTWREIGHLLADLPLALFGFTYVVTVLFPSAFLTLTVIGFPLLAAAMLGAWQLGKLERARARALLGVRVDEPSPLPTHGSGGFLSQVWMSVKDPVGWRTMRYEFMRLPWGIVPSPSRSPRCLLWPVLPYIARALTNVDRAMVRSLLSPSEELERRIAQLESDRGVVGSRGRHGGGRPAPYRTRSARRRPGTPG